MQKTIDKMRGWLTCLVVFSLMIITPFQDPQIALASDFVEELQWSQMETELLEGNSLEWHLETEQEAEDLIVADAEKNVTEEVMQNDVVMEEVIMENSHQEVFSEEAFAEDMVLEASAEEIMEEQAPRQTRELLLTQWRIPMNLEQLDLLERCVMAEGGGESYRCQVAIATVIINRVLSDKYPDTVEEVIKQPGQFSTWPTMIENMTATNEVKQAVREALSSEALPESVLYFRANRYHRWGSRYCRIDNTYFSTP